MVRFVIILVVALLSLSPWVWAGEGYQVQLKEVSPQKVVCVGGKAAMENIGQEMGKVYGQIFQYLGSQKTAPAAPPLAVYYSPSGQEIDFEACVPVAEGVSGKGEIEVKELAGGQMASVMHLGPYDGLGRAYDALVQWMTKEGYEAAGPPREVYLVGAPNDPSDYKTEILWPVIKK